LKGADTLIEMKKLTVGLAGSWMVSCHVWEKALEWSGLIDFMAAVSTEFVTGLDRLAALGAKIDMSIFCYRLGGWLRRWESGRFWLWLVLAETGNGRFNFLLYRAGLLSVR
jgi:hypothetical protein